MPRINVSVQASGTALDVYLNEYHIYSSFDVSHGLSTNIRPWLEKENLFRIKLTPSNKAKEGTPIRCKVEVTLNEGSQSRVLMQMIFPEGIAIPDVAEVPFDSTGKALATGQSLRFNSEPGWVLADRPWKATPRRIANPAEAFNLFAAIQKVFVEGNLEEAMALSQPRITFGARCFDENRATFETEVRKDLATTFADRPNWKVIARPEDELTLHEFLSGKVVRVLDLNGNPPLRTLPDKDGIQFGYDVIMAMTAEGLVWLM